MQFPKPVRWQSQKYRDGAKDQACSMRLPRVCTLNDQTTVLAHHNGGGMGTKHSDYNAADMCQSCHDEFDGRTHKGVWLEHELDDYFYQARFQTIANRIHRGILK